MKNLLLLFSFITVTAGCVATDLSDLDSLFINVDGTDGNLTISSLTTSEDVVVQSDTATQSGTNDGTNDLLDDDSDSDHCELMLCNTFNEFQYYYDEGAIFDFGGSQAELKSYHEFEDEDWVNWYDDQFGIRRKVNMARFEYLRKVQGRTIEIEMFYNALEGEFVMGRTFFAGEYENMKNFIVKRYYDDAREDFDSELKFTNNDYSKYSDNADYVFFEIIYELEENNN